jgi:hypothetical protein
MAESLTQHPVERGTGAEAPNPAADPRRGQAWPSVERRCGNDRRLRPTRWYDSLLGHRRRHRGRRQRESRNIYVDLYHVADLILISLIFLLNLVDAGLTLAHVAGGGVEQNPLMHELIRWGPAYFLLEKFLVVGLCLLAVVIHNTFKLARIGAWTLLAFYALLMVRHISYLI